MPSSSTIENQDTTVLNDLEKERVREIAGVRLYSTIEAAVDDLSTVLRQAMRADIEAWDKVGDGTIAAKGGRDGIDYSKVRDREDIRIRVRLRLGLSPFDPELNPNAAHLVWVPTEYVQADPETVGEF